MKKKIIIIIGTIAVFSIAAFLLLKSSSVKNTTWADENSVLRFGNTEYTWESAIVEKHGTYTTYKNKAASQAIDRYVKEYNKASDAPDAEKGGFENEVKKLKEQMTEQSFVIEENLDYVKHMEKEVPFTNTIYIANIKNDKLILTEVRTGATFRFKSCNKDTKPPVEKHAEGNVKAIDDDLTSDSHLPFTYQATKDAKKVYANKNAVYYLSNDNTDIAITISENVPLYGVVDGYPVKEKIIINNIEGYMITETLGAYVSYDYAFETGGNTYLVCSNDKDALETFVKTISL